MSHTNPDGSRDMNQAVRVPQSRAEADPRRWVALAILLVAAFMNLMDVTIVNVALPSLQQTLGASAAEIEWVVAAYVLAFALGLLPFGRLGDIVGRTRMFLVGVAAFSLASALCGLAPNIEWLIAARALQGLAGAMMAPQVLAITQVTFPPEERGQAFALFGTASGLAAVSGPLLGGLLIGADIFGLDWRPIFLVNVPIGLAAVIAGALLIPRTPGHPDLRNDFVGIGLFGVSAVALIFPLIEGRAFGWPLWAFLLMGLAGIGAALFVLWERRMARADRPQLLNYSLVSNSNFLLGVLITTIFASGIPGFFLVISLLLQSGFGFTPLQSGLTNTPFSVGVLLISFVAGRLGSRFLRGRLVVGALMIVFGMIWLRFVLAGVTETIDQWQLVVPLFIAGMGLGLGFSGLFQSVLAGVPPRDAGAGSGALQAFQQVGAALGVALIGQIFFSSLEAGLASGLAGKAAFSGSATTAVLYQVASFGAVAALAVFLRIPKAPANRVEAPPVSAEG
jgi:EmrB/QacA subfamily drug resistance transporter